MVSWLHTLPNLGGQADTPLFLLRLRTISFAKHLDNAQFSGHPSPSIRRLHRWAMAPSCAARCQQWCWTSVCGGCWAKLRTSLRGRPGWEGDKGPISCSAASIPMVDLNTFVASNSSSLLKSTHIFFEHHHFSCQFRPPYIFFSTARPGTLQSLFRCAPCPWSWTWCYCLSWIICTWCRPSSRHGCQPAAGVWVSEDSTKRSSSESVSRWLCWHSWSIQTTSSRGS